MMAAGLIFLILGLLITIISSVYAFNTIKENIKDKRFVLLELFDLLFGSYLGVGFFVVLGLGLMFFGYVAISVYF